MRLYCVRGFVTAGDIELSFSMWVTLLYGVVAGRDPDFVRPNFAPNFDDARTMLVRQWDAPLPVLLSTKYEPPGWTLNPLEQTAIRLFYEFVAALEKDDRFRLLNSLSE